MPITVAPYDLDWPRRFEAERAQLESLLAPWLIDGVHHRFHRDPRPVG